MTTDKFTTDNIIRFALVALIVVCSIAIIAPFVSVLLWAVIIAISVHPAFTWLSARLGDRTGLTATILVILLLALLVWPIAGSLPSFTDSIRSLADNFQSGTLAVPAASENVRQWPLIGEPLYELWKEAASNLGEVLEKFRPQLKSAGVVLLGSIASAGIAILQFIVSVMIAGVILAHHQRAIQLAHTLSGRILPESQQGLLALIENTVRGVTLGIIGVAVVQAILAGIGFVVIGIPAAAFWAFACLLLAIMQISIVLVVAPIAIYVFSSHELMPALLFVAWNLPVLSLDNVLKPILMGRGVDAPMLIIFIGAIGGFISFGFLGLFFGAVVLVIAYKLLIIWIDEGKPFEA